MDEHRSLKRRHLVYYLKVSDTQSGQLIGNLVDLTPQGLMLMSESPIETGREFALEIHEPKNRIGNRKLLIKAKSLWCNNDVNADFYDTGFAVKHMPGDIFRELEDLVDERGFRD